MIGLRLINKANGFSVRKMSAITFTFGSPSTSVKVTQTASVKTIGSGEVHISMKACPVTFEDIRAIRGLSFVRGTPGIGGAYGVGNIRSKSIDVANFRENEQVLVINDHGLSNEVAALIPEVASAYAMLHNFFTLSAGDVVVITDHNTTVHQSIQQICKRNGVTVVAASAADLNNREFKSKVQSFGPVRLAITSESGKRARVLGNLLSDNGILINHNAFIPSLKDTSPIELPISPLIFQNQSVRGFDFATFAKEQPEKCDDTIRNVATMLGLGEVVLAPVVFSQDKVLEALEAANNGQSVVLKI